MKYIIWYVAYELLWSLVINFVLWNSCVHRWHFFIHTLFMIKRLWQRRSTCKYIHTLFIHTYFVHYTKTMTKKSHLQIGQATWFFFPSEDGTALSPLLPARLTWSWWKVRNFLSPAIQHQTIFKSKPATNFSGHLFVNCWKCFVAEGKACSHLSKWF